MRAARYYGKEDVRIEQIEEPTVQPGQIAPAFVGICGTDLHEYLGGPNFSPLHPHPVTGDKVPITIGHEFSGTVKEVGPGVTGLTVGQKCAVQPMVCCGNCAACKAGFQNVCHTFGFIGLSGGGGGLSEAVCVNASHVFPLPDHIGLDIGALVEPLSVAWHGLSAAPEINATSAVLIIGGGPIGLALILCLKAKGVKNITVSEVATSRQMFAQQFGAARVINPLKVDLVEEMLQVSDGRGADVTFDCAGVPASAKCACNAVKTNGTVVNIAIWEKEIPFNPNWLTWKESSYKSVLGYQNKDFGAVIENLSTGALKPEGMITSRIKLENLVEGGIKTLISDKDNQVKILVDVNAR